MSLFQYSDMLGSSLGIAKIHICLCTMPSTRNTRLKQNQLSLSPEAWEYTKARHSSPKLSPASSVRQDSSQGHPPTPSVTKWEFKWPHFTTTHKPHPLLQAYACLCQGARSVAQSYRTLCDPVDCSPPVPCMWDYPAGILEWVAISYSRLFRMRYHTYSSTYEFMYFLTI